MDRIMLVGESGSGKSSLVRALSGAEFRPLRAMALSHHGPYTVSPGEFLENRRFYSALITASFDCAVLLLLQDAVRKSSLYPPLFAALFQRRVIGVISKTDADEARPERAERFLRNAGVKTLFRVSALRGTGMDALRRALNLPPLF